MPKFRLSQQPIWKSEIQTAVWRWVKHADRRFLVPRTNFYPTVLPFLAIVSCGRKTTLSQNIRKHRIPLDNLALSLWIYKMTRWLKAFVHTVVIFLSAYPRIASMTLILAILLNPLVQPLLPGAI